MAAAALWSTANSLPGGASSQSWSPSSSQTTESDQRGRASVLESEHTQRMYVRLYVCMYVCVFVYLCVNVSMYVCMYVCLCSRVTCLWCNTSCVCAARSRCAPSFSAGKENAECMLTKKSTHSYSCALHTPGRSVGVEGGHEKLIHVAAVQTCGSCEHVRLALCSAVRHCTCSALCSRVTCL